MSFRVLDQFFKHHAENCTLNAKSRLLFWVLCASNSPLVPEKDKTRTVEALARQTSLSVPVTRKWLQHLEKLGYVYRPSKRAKNTFKPRIPNLK